MYVKRVVKEAGGGPGVEVDDPKFQKEFPAMFEYLANNKLEDGTPRKLAKFTVSINEGRWSICFVDNDNGRLFYLSGTSFASLMTAVEKKLAGDTAEWRGAKTFGKGK